MPLLLMCGLPSSGKSLRAKSIASHFCGTGRQVVVIDDGTVSPKFDKNATYSDSLLEKELRGEILSAVQRQLSKTKLLIVDSLNYIKGYRYELYCAAKAAQSTFCVVYCECDIDVVVEWNVDKDRVESNKAYQQTTLQNLISRFEPPDANNRWDSPLFSVTPTADTPFDLIEAALFKTKPAKQNKATLATPVAPTHVSYDIDRITQDIITAFVSQVQSEDFAKSDVVTLRISSATLQLRCKTDAGFVPAISEADLQRCRRDFIALFRNKTHLTSSSDSANIPSLFIAFLESRLFPGLTNVTDKPNS